MPLRSEDDGGPKPDEESRGRDGGIPLELRLYTVEELAVILKRSAKSISVDVTRKPQSLPPVFRMPGTRKILFRHPDVVAWMDGLSESAERRLEAEAQASRRSLSKSARRR